MIGTYFCGVAVEISQTASVTESVKDPDTVRRSSTSGRSLSDKLALCQLRLWLFYPVLEIFSATGYGETKLSVVGVKSES